MQVFFGTLIIQPVKKYHTFIERMFYCSVHKNLSLDPILSQPNLVHIVITSFSKIHFNIILRPKPRSPDSLPSSGFWTTNLVGYAFIPACVLHVPSIFNWVSNSMEQSPS
jgi:hypothetical protein